MNYKKVLALALAAAMASSTFVVSAAETEGSVTFPLEETMEFTGFAVMNGEYALSDSLAWQTSLERANINIELTNVMASEKDEKRNLLLASNSYPDVFIKAGGDMNEMGMEGIYIPLEDLIREYAPNLTALLDACDGWDYITAPDGHVYSLPGMNRQEPQDCAFWINQKWMDNLGLEEPTSYEELYEVLKAFKEQDANGNGDPDDEIPFSIATSEWSLMHLMLYEDYPFHLNTKLGIIDGELTYVPTDESFKEFLEYVTKLYQEGLIDKNAFTQSSDQFTANGQVDDTYGSFFREGAFLVVGRDNDDDYIALTPFQEGTYSINNPVQEGGLMITDACEHPEVIIAWADYFYSEEGGILAWMGVEGETFEWNEDGTWSWITGTEYGEDVSEVRAKSTIQGAGQIPVHQPDAWYEMSAEVDPDEVYLNEQRAKVVALGTTVLPPLTYTEDEQETIATITADINPYISQYIAEVATGQKNLEETWEEYLNTVNAMGAEDLIEAYKAAYTRATE